MYTFGYNGTGGCGVGDTADRNHPTRVRKLPRDDPVVAIRAAGIVLARTRSGNVYAWGEHAAVGLADPTTRTTNNKVPRRGQTCIGTHYPVCVAVPAAKRTPPRATVVAADIPNTSSASGGASTSTSTSTSSNSNNSSVLTTEAVRTMSVGPTHAVIVTRSGRLVVWGEKSALPYGGTRPEAGVLDEAINQVVCGTSYTLLLTHRSRVQVSKEQISWILLSFYLWSLSWLEPPARLRDALAEAAGPTDVCRRCALPLPAFIILAREMGLVDNLVKVTPPGKPDYSYHPYIYT